MTARKSNLMRRSAVVLAASLMILGIPALAQQGAFKTNTRILYHDGPVMPGNSNVYFIMYGCWTCGPGNDYATFSLLANVAVGLVGTSYMGINAMYPDASGEAPFGAAVYGGAASDAYSRGPSLTDADVQEVIWDQIMANRLPQDSRGIYLVLTSSDVTFDGFCTNVAQYHSNFIRWGISHNYGVIGNPLRCPAAAAPQFVAPNGTLLPTPNDNFAADGMATWIAHVISGTLTNPWGNGWHDRYGLENSDKCQGKFGTTYTTANGAEANMQLLGRDFLIQQNWVNERKGYCALARP